jgi:hypothetical protein
MGAFGNIDVLVFKELMHNFSDELNKRFVKKIG